MATQSQIDANRRNAQKSTGPTTPEGRAAVRHNALKHGLTAEVFIPSTEEQPEFDRLCDAFETEYQPNGPTEESLLENLVAAKWRLGRSRKAETGFFMKRSLDLEHESQDYRELPANGRLALIVDLDSAGPDTLAKISRYEARLERSFYKALSELRRTQSERDPAESPAAKQTQSEDQPPDLTPPPVASDPAPEPEPSEIRNPTSEIPRPAEPPAAKQTQSEDQPPSPTSPPPASEPSENQHPTTNIQHPFSSATLNCYSRGRTAPLQSRRGHPARRRLVSTVGRLLLEARSHRSIRMV